ncbi:MAG TPA: 50S ribosomal protein L19e [archaeon]|jgi:large subunit ribosomal protein L19e|nr:50S ribosomal protein L19e [archaeon]
MKLNKLKDISGTLLKKSKHKLVVDKKAYDDNKEFVDKAITKQDVREIISKGVIKKKADTGQSRGRARVLLEKKKLKRKRGQGKRKGTPQARQKRNTYNERVRGLRKRLRELRKEDKLNDKVYSKIYLMIKGNYFRGKKHLEEYISGENK